MLTRAIKLSKSHSLFLFGARQTGKTTLVTQQFSPTKTKTYNLLITSEHLRLAANPNLFREEILALSSKITHVFVDEVQRVPDLLNEVQVLITGGAPQKFILTGSSARKLKRNNANLLGGRALTYMIFPLTIGEIGEHFDLDLTLQFGSLPHIFNAKSETEKAQLLRSYTEVYLKEEIEAEALTRNIGGFIRFLSVAAQTNTEMCNFANIARDVQLNPVTTKEYFKILEDTLIGQFLLPFHGSERKRHKLSPKFYFFDTGVVRAIEQRLTAPLQNKTFEYGKYFESWVINEVFRFNRYADKDWKLSFLRTANDVEVDLIIETPRGKTYAIEIKSKPVPTLLDFQSGFKAILALVPNAKCLCICTGGESRLVGGYQVLPWRAFLDDLLPTL